ncbi:NADP-dependent oxidoreductase [Deinococcus sp. YIM 134068]|uniref:NADP-dependent oxidoreductase n=1 Tax=Deinococcus lichenicola TaxID=3118910 RepID=UPI002F93750D
MRAARLHSFGPPSVLRVEEVAWPFPVRDEVLIRVHASSVNGTDLRLRAGGLGFLAAGQLPLTPGFDVAGEVAGCGPEVTAFRPGERVYALLGHGGGGAAEYVTARQSRVALAPATLPLTHAAAVPLAGLTALQALRGVGRLRAGERVLVYGAAGGIGAFAVALARLFGAHVTGVARAAKLDYVRSLGAHEVVATGELNLSGGERWDLILDTPPALPFTRAREALTPSGRLVSTKPVPLHPAEMWASLSQTGPRFTGVRTAERGLDLALLSRLIDAGELRVPLDRTFPLEDIRAAHEYAEGPEVRGKVVVTMVGE